MDEIFTSLAGSLTVGGVTILIVQNYIRRKLADVDKVPTLESRVAHLEIQATQHNDTKEAVIRMEEQIKGLTEQVRQLSDLLMRKVFK